MASASEAKTQWDELVECPICKDVFTDPRSLPCVHTFCLNCIEGASRDKLPGDAVCPLCRTEFTIPATGLSGLPKNYFINKMMQLGKMPTGVGVRNTDCGNLCEACASEERDDSQRNKATVHCVECQQKLCEDCSKADAEVHPTHQHDNIDTQNVTTEMRMNPPEKCEKHPEKNLEIYCLACETVICMMCFFDDHSEHKCTDVRKVVNEFRNQLHNDIRAMKSGVEKYFKNLNEIAADKERFVHDVCRVKDEICARAEELKQMIDLHKKKISDELEDMKMQRLKQVRFVEEEMQQQISLTESLKKYSTELADKGSASEIAREVSSLHKKTNDLAKYEAIEQALHDLGSIDVIFTSSTFLCNDRDNIIGSISATKRSEDAATSTLIRAIIPSVDSSAVRGITSLYDKLFVAHWSHRDIEVYDTTSFSLLKHIVVSELSTEISGLASCAANNCLYVSDWRKSTVHKVELSDRNPSVSWTVCPRPRGLYVNSHGNVVVTCYYQLSTSQIVEYTTDGALVRAINVHGELIAPRHAIELDSDRFIVSHGYEGALGGGLGAKHRVCEFHIRLHILGSNIDRPTESHILASYGNKPGSGTGELRQPRDLAVDNNGLIYVADMYNNRIVVLTPSLVWSRDLQVPGELQRPRAIHLDASRGRLYVGEESNGRLLVIDIASKE